MADVDPVVDLVRQAMASAVLVHIEDPTSTVRMLSAARDADPGAGLHTGWTKTAEDFVRIRYDLVEPLRGSS